MELQQGVKILKQLMITMGQAIIKKCNVNSNNVFDNTFGIDFNTVYTDYNYSSPTV